MLEVLTIFLIVSIVAVGIVFLVLYLINFRYKNFVSSYCESIKQLEIINKKYCFNKIPSFNMENIYDNERVFLDMTCKDYLVYELIEKQNQVRNALKKTLENYNLYNNYINEINDTLIYGIYNKKPFLMNDKRLKSFERKIVEKNKLKPTIKFSIRVTLYLTKINGEYKDEKRAFFGAKEVKDIIRKINQKQGYYYTDEIWKSLCKVERGKVTNKIRFAIYERDGYRCVRCGKYDNGSNLEIDHIIPISKGGKSTFDNLQTLCHDCNKEKGSKIYFD